MLLFKVTRAIIFIAVKTEDFKFDILLDEKSCKIILICDASCKTSIDAYPLCIMCIFFVCIMCIV